MQPSTPPPPRREPFAALTIASTFIFVMSFRTICKGICLLSPLLIFSDTEPLHFVGFKTRRRRHFSQHPADLVLWDGSLPGGISAHLFLPVCFQVSNLYRCMIGCKKLYLFSTGCRR